MQRMQQPQTLKNRTVRQKHAAGFSTQDGVCRCTNPAASQPLVRWGRLMGSFGTGSEQQGAATCGPQRGARAPGGRPPRACTSLWAQPIRPRTEHGKGAKPSVGSPQRSMPRGMGPEPRPKRALRVHRDLSGGPFTWRSRNPLSRGVRDRVFRFRI